MFPDSRHSAANGPLALISPWTQEGTTGSSISQMEALRLEAAVPKVLWLVSSGPGLRLREVYRMGLRRARVGPESNQGGYWPPSPRPGDAHFCPADEGRPWWEPGWRGIVNFMEEKQPLNRLAFSFVQKAV